VLAFEFMEKFEITHRFGREEREWLEEKEKRWTLVSTCITVSLNYMLFTIIYLFIGRNTSY
jgi:hypothetical protein